MRPLIKIQNINTDQLLNPEDKYTKNIGVAIITINNIKIKIITSKRWSNICQVKWLFFGEDPSVIKVALF